MWSHCRPAVSGTIFQVVTETRCHSLACVNTGVHSMIGGRACQCQDVKPRQDLRRVLQVRMDVVGRVAVLTKC